MPLKVIDAPTLRQQRVEASHKNPIRYTRPAVVYGRPVEVPIEIAAGEMQAYGLELPLAAYLSPYGAGAEFNQQAAGELLTTPANLNAYVQKTVVDLEIGRDSVPLLYPPLFRTINDANLTENVDVGVLSTRASVVFLDFRETGEVKFGTRTLSPGQTVSLSTYAAGFEYTEDMVEYDKTWEVTQLNEAFGRAYNALLNHIHLYPIISYSYASKNLTAAVSSYTGADGRLLNIRETIKNGLIASGQDKNTDSGIGRSPTVLMTHSSRRWDLEEALQTRTVGGSVYPALAGIDTLLFYDGYSIKVGAKTYQYGGCGVNEAYLIDTSTYLIELVKHDLRVDAGPGDLSRLIQQQIVARTRRGVFISPPNAVQKLTLPA